MELVHFMASKSNTICGRDTAFHRVSKNWNSVTCPNCLKVRNKSSSKKK